MKQRLWLFGILICLIFLGGALFFYLQSGDRLPGSAAHPGEAKTRAHVYKVPDRLVDSVHLRVFYAVPQDKAAQSKNNWQEIISRVFSDVSRFHEIQFRGFSKIDVQIFPEQVLLDHESIFYDSEKTDAGNPHALLAVAQEIERRIATPGGDLYREEFATRKDGEYVVMGIIYEGVGGSGGLIYDSPLGTPQEISLQLGIPESLIHIVNVESSDGFFLANSDCLAGPVCGEPGPSLIYHEFAHALGIQDQYEGDHSYSEDVMGLGRFKTLDSTYLDRSILKEMGVL
jgi:hypothetical protein